MQKISIKEELSFYDLEGRWNDYIGVQKAIIHVLKTNSYFDNGEIINDETGMTIRITPRGIKETIGNGNRFQSLPKKVKEQKIATLRVLPILVKEAKLIKDEVQSYHEKRNETFAYFISKILIDGEIHDVRIVVKKKVSTNHFYIHHIDTQKVPNCSAHLK